MQRRDSELAHRVAFLLIAFLCLFLLALGAAQVVPPKVQLLTACMISFGAGLLLAPLLDRLSR